MSLFSWLFRKPSPEAEAAKVEARAEKILAERREKEKIRISGIFAEKLNEQPTRSARTATRHGLPVREAVELKPYTPPKGVAPAAHVVAMDSSWSSMANSMSGGFSGQGFPGFPYLTELTQITEYRDISERVAYEMVRKWIKMRSVSGEDRSEEIKIIEAALRRYKVRDLFRQSAVLDGQMGRGQIFVDCGDTEGPELKTPLMLNPFKIPKGCLRGFKVVEPISTYPAQYNSSVPLQQDYYVPSSWFVFGQEVHASRMLTFVSRPLPDLLKPAYNFSGMSLSQLAVPYVDYWLSTRDSVGDLLRNFSTCVYMTNMDDVLSGGSGQNFIARAQAFTQMRDNQGLMVLDKAKEDFVKHDTSLAGLDKLQAQAQEHMAAVAKTPLSILLGITPTGLNASSDGEVRTFYDYVADLQEALFRSNLEIIIKVVCLSELGYVDEDITFDFAPLMEMSEKERSLIRKSNSDSATAYNLLGAVSAEEIRENLINDPESGWNNLVKGDASNKLTPNMAAAGSSVGASSSAEAGAEQGAESASDAARMLHDAAYVLMLDADWHGNQHTGSFGGPGEAPLATAMKASGYAQKASSSAKKADTSSAHQRALSAHQRALAAHESALVSSSPQSATVHGAYIEAHQAAMAFHALCAGGAK